MSFLGMGREGEEQMTTGGGRTETALCVSLSSLQALEKRKKESKES